MSWNYTREESTFETLPAGKYRVRIKETEMAVSQTGNNMLVLTFDVSGHTQTLRHYIVFLKDRPEITNRNLTNFYDSFKDIPEGDNQIQNWVGKVGACVVKHEEYNGETRARISYFIKADKQAELPAWQEPGAQAGNPNVSAVVDAINELPF